MNILRYGSLQTELYSPSYGVLCVFPNNDIFQVSAPKAPILKIAYSVAHGRPKKISKIFTDTPWSYRPMTKLGHVVKFNIGGDLTHLS